MTNATMPQVPICGVVREVGLWWEVSAPDGGFGGS